MKYLFRFFLVLIIILGLGALTIALTGNNHFWKALRATYLMGETGPHIADWQEFDTRIIEAREGQPWPISPNFNEVKISDSLHNLLQKLGTVAFVVAKNDSLIFEEYWDGYNAQSHSNSFSMAKSITTMLTQIAIQHGHFRDWDDDVAKYLPGLGGEYSGELRLSGLATMSAGLSWNEQYSNPFDITAQSYYGSDISQTMLTKVTVNQPPQEKYSYQSGATQLLGMAVINATGRPLAEYAQEMLWNPIGAEENALWLLDKADGTEIAYAGFNSNARDFARIGQLLLRQGNWKGNQLIDSAFVKIATTGQLASYYGYSFWLYRSQQGMPVFYLRGIGGQYIIVIPEKEMVICRLGHKRLANENHHPKDFKVIVEEVLKTNW